MKLLKHNAANLIKRMTNPSKSNFIKFTPIFIASTVTVALQFTFISAAKADGFMNTYFRDGQIIKLVTPKNLNVNLPYTQNGGMINTFEPDNTNDWKFLVIRTRNGIKLKRVGTDYLITAQKFPSYNLALLEAYKDVGGEDKYQTWVPVPSKPGFFNICLLAQPDQCMNVPGSTNRTKLTTFKRDLNDQDQWFAAVKIEEISPGRQDDRNKVANNSLSKNVRAFLDTIAYAEGTRNLDGYRTIYGYEKFDSFNDHPRRAVTAGGYTSDAAGRYQMLSSTWDRVKNGLGLPDFSPANQDMGAVLLIKWRGALEDVEAGRISDAIQKCNYEWASLPGSPYGQPVKTMDELLKVYQDSLSKYN